jgi:UDP-glucose 4-epimerase
MILVIGGLGFIGSHTTRALLDLGQSCVLAQRSAASVPDLISDELGRRVFVEQADVTGLSALREIGERHEVTGIVYLAGSFGLDNCDPVGGARAGIQGLLNVLEAAIDWQVPRVGIASTIGVYDGPGDSPLREDTPLPLTAVHPIPAAKKVGELLASYIAGAAGLEIYNFRIAAAWGPLGRPASRFIAAPEFVHAAVRGLQPGFAMLRSPAYADDGLDLVYVRDCGRAIALLQVAERLSHATYNVASGQPTTNRQLAAAIAAVVPDAQIELADGRDPNGPGRDFYLDISRIQADTGYQPGYDTERAVADYIGWLRAGHER